MPQLPVLLADLGDVIGALVPVVFFIIWVIGQIAGRKQEPAKPVRGPERRPAADLFDDDDDVIVAAPAPQANVGGKKTVFDEIEQFLARARQQAQQGQQGNAPQPPRPAAPPLAGRPSVTVQTVVVRPQAAEPVVAEVIEPRRTILAEAAPGPGQLAGRQQVAAHVTQYLDTADMRAQVDRLGDAVEVADDVMEEHLKQVFDHRVGTLATDAAQSAPARPGAGRKRAAAAPVDFAAMLANTGNLRQAIVLNEILQRPADRW
jgi:hypothetical protein